MTTPTAREIVEEVQKAFYALEDCRDKQCDNIRDYAVFGKKVRKQWPHIKALLLEGERVRDLVNQLLGSAGVLKCGCCAEVTNETLRQLNNILNPEFPIHPEQHAGGEG